jgi:probable rRNA maturation factor
LGGGAIVEVFVANEQEIRVSEARLSALARHALDCLEVDGAAELSVLLITADHMRRLNARFAGEDEATDVLAFPMMEEEGEEEEGSLLLGDVVVCPEVARTNAKARRHPLEQELEILLVHGTLHLLGYDHQGADDKSKMDEHLAQVIASFQSE